MKILVISNFYPPYYIGGYELGCRDVVEGLKDRGHEVKVLTSTYGIDNADDDGHVYRWLYADYALGNKRASMFINLFRKEINNCRAFKELFDVFRPDVVYLWNLAGISINISFIAQRAEVPILYFVSDDWLSRWESDYWYSLWSRKVPETMVNFGIGFLSGLPKIIGVGQDSSFLDLRHVHFVSRYLKYFALKAGKAVRGAKIIHWNVDTDRYPYKVVSHEPKRLLYVGQIVPHKGVETAIQAMRIIVRKKEHAKLTIVGGTIISDYEKNVRNLVSSLGLDNHISFVGHLLRPSVAAVYQDHDVLIFPSIWDEPFSITLLEGLSSGLAVVGTTTGGSAEILKDEVNALVFPKENAKACAAQVLRLMDDPELFEKIRQNGRRTVEEKFSFEGMMDKIDGALQETIASCKSNNKK